MSCTNFVALKVAAFHIMFEASHAGKHLKLFLTLHRKITDMISMVKVTVNISSPKAF